MWDPWASSNRIKPRISRISRIKNSPSAPLSEKISTEANEGNEGEFFLRSLRSLLFKRNPRHLLIRNRVGWVFAKWSDSGWFRCANLKAGVADNGNEPLLPGEKAGAELVLG